MKVSKVGQIRLSNAEERFPEELATKVGRHAALREIARCFLAGAGVTVPGELARVTALTRPEAGLGNRALVEEGYAVKVTHGTYRLAALGAIGCEDAPHRPTTMPCEYLLPE